MNATSLLTVRQLSQRTGIPAPMLRAAARDGCLPAGRVRPRGRWLFDLPAVQAALTKLGGKLPEPQPAGGAA